jgi:haloacetate dehalogenase
VRTDFLNIWKRWANDVSGRGLACGHFLPEEAPETVLAALQPFLERAFASGG